MITSEARGLATQPWKVLYQAAITETDINKLPERLSDAEAALTARARELFYASGDDGEEGESLDNAMCILHSLRQSLNRRPLAVPSQTVAMTVSQRKSDLTWQTA
jgi:hypothetical protein